MSRRGLTLVELVITIVLAALIGVPVGLLVSEHLGGALRARDEVLGMSLARRELERLDSFDNFFHSDLALGTPPDQLNYAGTPYTLRSTVDCIEGNCTTTATSSQGVKRITVRVFRPNAGDPAATLLATLVTYRTKHVAFGT